MSLYLPSLRPFLLFQFAEFSVELCVHPERLELAQRLRYQAFGAAGMIDERADGLLTDPYDAQANSRTLLVSYQGRAVGTIRNSLFAADYAWQPSYLSEQHTALVHATLGPETPFLESGRFATHPDLSGKTARIVQGLLFRAQTIAASTSPVARVLTLVKPNHVRFYERYMGFTRVDDIVETEICPAYLLVAAAWAECQFPYAAYDFLGQQKAELQQRYRSLLNASTNFTEPDKAA